MELLVLCLGMWLVGYAISRILGLQKHYTGFWKKAGQGLITKPLARLLSQTKWFWVGLFISAVIVYNLVKDGLLHL